MRTDIREMVVEPSTAEHGPSAGVDLRARLAVAEPARRSPLRREGLWARIGPFVTVGMLSFALVPATRPENTWAIGAAAGAIVVLLAATLWLPWPRMPPWTETLVPLAASLTVALLVLSHPPGTTPYQVLFVLPVLWATLYGTRWAVVAVVALAAATLVADSLVFAGSDAHVLSWEEVLTYTAAGALVGWSGRRLVTELEHRELILRRSAELSRVVGLDQDWRLVVCRELKDITGAAFALLFEVSADDAKPDCTAAAGIDEHRAASVPATVGVFAALASEASVIERLRPGERWPDMPPGTRTMLHVPARGQTRIGGVLQLGWTNPGGESDSLLRSIALLVGALVGAALEREGRVAELDEMSRVDPLTGAANRREWNARLAVELGRARRQSGPLVVAMADLDNFKRFNDTRGHQAGDELLRSLIARWRRRLRDTDVLARYGGEEFVLALPDCDLPAALDLVEELRSQVPSGQTCSFGLARWDGAEAAAGLVARADRALYAAKAAGRDRALVDDHPMVSPPLRAGEQ